MQKQNGGSNENISLLAKSVGTFAGALIVILNIYVSNDWIGWRMDFIW